MTTTLEASVRQKVLARIRELCEALSDRRYFVKRGVINWAAFDFGKNQYAISIMMDETTILSGALSDGDNALVQEPFNRMSIGLEIFTKMPGVDEDQGIDDGVLDTLLNDGESVISDLIQSRIEGTENCLIGTVRNPRAVEARDAHIGVQGVVLTFDVEF